MKKILLSLFIMGSISSIAYSNVTGFTLGPRGEMTDMSTVAGESVQLSRQQAMEDRIAIASQSRYR
ncbi:hypothetical protein LO80_03470 [Candidatus Francisella endociliophora]|uniref:Uncharacterized protein n=1 Tax=Candidatus Francisella endociliophora TaxID=653937 RepID=A0A097ENH4_9GAMM|nr:hypothetical protein [Francisella sp. FSC1006]AIT09117.1 hypothetical protein LO80_03470 [Francisella sp. FSC1006]